MIVQGYFLWRLLSYVIQFWRSRINSDDLETALTDEILADLFSIRLLHGIANTFRITGPSWGESTDHRLFKITDRAWNFTHNICNFIITTVPADGSELPVMLHASTRWGRVTHICVSKLTIIGSDNGLSPGLGQAIIWTNDGILLIWTLGTNFSEILSEIHIFSFKKIHLKMSSGKRQPFCLSLNVLLLWHHCYVEDCTKDYLHIFVYDIE